MSAPFATLPSGPLALWLKSHPEDMQRLAARSGVAVETLWARRRPSHDTVSLDEADRLLCADGVLLQDVWPDIDALMGVHS